MQAQLASKEAEYTHLAQEVHQYSAHHSIQELETLRTQVCGCSSRPAAVQQQYGGINCYTYDTETGAESLQGGRGSWAWQLQRGVLRGRRTISINPVECVIQHTSPQ
jgi:hypothetical protein